MLCTILPEETALVSESVFDGMHYILKLCCRQGPMVQ